MNCYFHPEEVSVASCVDCGKGLCQTCAAKYSISICDSCNTKRGTADIKKNLKKFIPSFILHVAGFVCFFLYVFNDFPIFPRIFTSFFTGLVIGGTVYGLIYTRAWFRSKTGVVIDHPNMSGVQFFKDAFRLSAWCFTSIFVGTFVMTGNLVKFIIAIARAKKVSAVSKKNS